MFCRYPKIWNKKVADLCNSIQKKFIKKLDDAYRSTVNNTNTITTKYINNTINPHIGSTFIIFYISTMAYFFFKR